MAMNQLESPIAGYDVTKSFTDQFSDSTGKQSIEKAAREFEAVFVSMLLKSMRQSMSEEMFPDDASDTFGGMFDTFMGQHIADHGGIGLSTFFQSLNRDSDGSSADSRAPLDHQKSVEAYRHASNI